MPTENSKNKGNPPGKWFYVALEPGVTFVLLDMLERYLKRRNIPRRTREQLILLHYIVEGACSQASDMSSDE